ncbi:SGNH/GDSL hydrolase family protein [Tichowtungia aerotolerans]
MKRFWSIKIQNVICVFLFFAEGLACGAENNDPTVAEEFRKRDGLPNFFQKINQGSPVRIAYLGGSITAASGWRPKTMEWFRQQYPQVEFVEINVAVSGTGSDFSACRLEEDVLSQNPDLVFLECRVNGGGGFERESSEGVVRQIWRSNPQIDICFVYTINLPRLKTVQDGRLTGFGEILERVANQYGIPSIDLGVEIAKLEQAGKLVFKGEEPGAGKILFTKDGAHPLDEGHNLYCKVVARSMLKMQEDADGMVHAVGKPLYENCWETAELLPIHQAQLSSGWTDVNIMSDSVYRDDFGRTKSMLRDAVKCERPGETITVHWNGTTVGFSDIPYGDVAEVEAVIDGKQIVNMERRQTQKMYQFSRFWYLPPQPPGEHTVCLTVKHLPEGQSFYAGQILIVGTAVK